MKLCIIAPYPPPYGGISNWVMLIENYIARNREDISLRIIDTSPKNKVAAFRPLWDRVLDSGISMIWKRKELIKMIRENPPDVVHMTTSGRLSVIRDILLLKILKKNQVAATYHIRFGRVNDLASRNNGEWRLLSKAMKLSSEVIAIDKLTYRTIKEHLPMVSVSWVPNPIDLSGFPEPVPASENSIVFIGWVLKNKGIEELLTAWERVWGKHQDWTLKIVGPCKEDYLSSLKNRFSFQGVIFEGEKRHDEAMDILNSSEIFILPSYTEGFPNTVLEAMSLAKPTIATHVGAIPDMLSGDCGEVIEPGASEPIEKAINRFIENKPLREKMGQKAYLKVKNDYEIETVFQRYLSIWEKDI